LNRETITIKLIFILLIVSLNISCDNRVGNVGSRGPQAPTIEIQLNKTQMHVGDTLEITLNGSSEIGLFMIWWAATNENLGDLSVAHIYYCNGSVNSTHTWYVKMESAMSLTLGANARDIEYGVSLGEPHQASDGAGMAYATVSILP